MRSDTDMQAHTKALEKLRSGYVRNRSVRAAQAKISANTAENEVAINVATDRVLLVLQADELAKRKRRLV